MIVIRIEWNRIRDADDDSTRAIVNSGLSAAAQERCFHMLAKMRSAAEEESICATDDRGMTLEFTQDDREVTFVVPHDASVRYFVARGAENFRRAGVIADDSAIPALADWLRGSRSEFPTDHLVVGNRSNLRR